MNTEIQQSYIRGTELLRAVEDNYKRLKKRFPGDGLLRIADGPIIGAKRRSNRYKKNPTMTTLKDFLSQVEVCTKLIREISTELDPTGQANGGVPTDTLIASGIMDSAQLNMFSHTESANASWLTNLRPASPAFVNRIMRMQPPPVQEHRAEGYGSPVSTTNLTPALTVSDLPELSPAPSPGPSNINTAYNRAPPSYSPLLSETVLGAQIVSSMAQAQDVEPLAHPLPMATHTQPIQQLSRSQAVHMLVQSTPSRMRPISQRTLELVQSFLDSLPPPPSHDNSLGLCMCAGCERDARENPFNWLGSSQSGQSWGMSPATLIHEEPLSIAAQPDTPWVTDSH